MNSGKLRQRIKVQSRTSEKDDLGQVNSSWTTLVTVWASYKSHKAVEEEQASRTKEKQLCTFRVRFRESLAYSNTDLRIEWKSNIYRVVGSLPVNDGRDCWLDLQCEL